MLDSLTVNVLMGIGDIFWVHRRMAPLAKVVNYNILEIDEAECGCPQGIQRRAEGFVRLFPGVGEVQYHKVSMSTYTDLDLSTMTIEKFLDTHKFWNCSSFSINRWLESGNRLEALSPEYPTQWDMPLRDERADMPFPEYVAVYVSKNRHPDFWTPDQWVEMLHAFLGRLSQPLPLVFLGAEYDHAIQTEIALKLGRLNHECRVIAQMEPAKAVYAIRKAKFFIGFQSGLNVIADNADVPQINMVFPQYEKELYAWCKLGNGISSIYNAYTFKKSPESVAESAWPGMLETI